MKKSIMQISTLLLVILVCAASLPVSASAAGNVTYLGKSKGFDVGTTSAYTSSDLFGSFKNVMPGDKLHDTVLIENKSTSCDFIKVFLRAVPHGDSNLPQAQEIGSVPEMVEFLNLMNLTVTSGNKVLFDGKAGETAQLSSNVFVAQLRRGKSTSLNLTLDVPITVGNEFADQIGEVDWVFTVEEHNYDKEHLIQTGQRIWPILVFGGLGIALVAGGVLLMRKKQDA